MNQNQPKQLPTSEPRGCSDRGYFQSRESAEKVSERIRKERRVDCYVYDCPDCGGYHIVKRLPDHVDRSEVGNG